MKKTLLLGLLLAAITAHAQPFEGWYIIPHAGMNVSTLQGYAHIQVNYMLYSDDDRMAGDDAGISQYGVGTSSSSMKHPMVGAIGGVAMEYQGHNGWAYSVGAEWSRQGARFAEVGVNPVMLTNGRILLDYIQMPLLVRKYMTYKLAIGTGLMPEMLLTQKAKGTFNHADAVVSYDISSSAENYQKFGVSIPVSIAYDIDGRNRLELTYSYGITNRVSGAGSWDPERPECHSHCVCLTVGHKFKL